ncbi:unnamed protein product, partial [Hymenolepis diminuta]
MRQITEWSIRHSERGREGERESYSLLPDVRLFHPCQKREGCVLPSKSQAPPHWSLVELEETMFISTLRSCRRGDRVIEELEEVRSGNGVT